MIKGEHFKILQFLNIHLNEFLETPQWSFYLKNVKNFFKKLPVLK